MCHSAQCENKTFTATQFFSSIQFRVIFFSKKLIWRFFRQNRGGSPQCSVEFKNFCITWELFRESNLSVKLFPNKMFSRKFFKKAVIQNFRKLHRVLPVEFGNFHSVLSYPTLCWQKFRISNCFTKELRSYERVDFTKNKFAEIEFLVFPYCKRNLLWQKFRESNIFTKEITK